MNPSMAYQVYHKSQAHECMEPQQLTLLLYKEAIKRLNLTKSALLEENIPKRGENLGRAIAIISELNACLQMDTEAEEILFLRGLYASILTELPKINVTKSVDTIDTVLRYMQKLKEIWENDVMGKKKPETQSSSAKTYEYA